MAVVYLYLNANANPAPPDGRNNERTFGALAVHYQRENPAIQIHDFSSGQEAIDIVSRYDRIDRLIILAHGAPRAIGWLRTDSGGGIHVTRRANQWKPLSQFVQVLGPRLAPNTIIGLLACSCGLNPQIGDRNRNLNKAVREGRHSETNLKRRRRIFWDIDGNNSFGYKLRDGLSRYTSVEVRAHLTRGPAESNPHCISFISPAGRPGFILSKEELDRPLTTDSEIANYVFTWNRRFAGREAEQWILGGPLPDNMNIAQRYPEIEEVSSVMPSSTGYNSEVTSPGGGSYNNSGTNIAQGDLPPESTLRTNLQNWASATERTLNQNL